MSREGFSIGEYYHCYNRGTDKKEIFVDSDDFQYFLDALDLFNQIDSLHSMRAYKYKTHEDAVHNNKLEKLVDIASYCLNKNHYHLLLSEKNEGGISKFIQKVSTGFTHYFNKKYIRSGVLFQGKFKYVRIRNDNQLRHIGAYINLNNLVHKISDTALYRSSIDTYNKADSYPNCKHDILTTEYDSIDDYRKSILTKLPGILERKKTLGDLSKTEYLYD